MAADTTSEDLKRYYQSNTEYRDDLITHDEPFLYPYLLLIKKYIQPKSCILDLGCGTGLSTRLLQAEDYVTVGADISPLFLSVEKQSHPETQLISGNALGLPFRDHAFDAVCAFEFIEHIPDIPALLNEVNRVLKPGGWIILHSPNLISPYLPAFDIWRMTFGGEGRPVFAETYWQAWNWLWMNTSTSFKKMLSSEVRFSYRLPDLSGSRIGGDADSVYLSNPLDLSKYLKQRNYTIYQQAHAMSFKNKCLAKLTPGLAPYMGLVARKSMEIQG